MLGFDLGFWILAILAVWVTGVSKSGFAGGVGVIAVPLLALYIDPRQAAAIMLPLLVLMDAVSMKAWWGKLNLTQYRRLIGPACIGIAIGYFTFDLLNADLIKIVLGVLSIVFCLWGFASNLQLGETKTGNLWIARLCGTITGFTSFLAHAGGPPLNLYLLPLRLPRPEYLATVIFTIATVNLVKLVPYAMLGQLNGDNLLISLILMPVAWLGAKYGIRLQAVISDQWFYRIIYSALGLIGAKLLLDTLF